MGAKRTNLKESRKGEHGSILIIGGSDVYTGAPLFTALGALRSGSELVYIMPGSDTNLMFRHLLEAIVLPFEFNEHVLDKITCVVIGPGLGIELNKEKIECLLRIVSYLDQKAIPFVIDGDGIHYYKQELFKDVKRLVITPNHVESDSLRVEEKHYTIFKGKHDQITYNNNVVVVSSRGSPKRIAGQGDILAGILSTFLSNAHFSMEKACKISCKLMRKASYLTFKKKRFAMITSDIFKSLSRVLKSYYDSKLKKLLKRLKSSSKLN